MANAAKRVFENVLGDFFVDSTCIDCDACRQIAPTDFSQALETSYVSHQPEKPADRRAALHALLSCPTGSIGCLGDNDAKAVMTDFPLLVELLYSGPPMKTVLFLCTGNYYRSRYAEILFNAKAEEMGLEWNAVSRGLAPDPRNPGPMFHETIKALQQQGISVENHLRLPMKVTEADFESNDHIVAVKEAEHRPMMLRNFPDWVPKVEFWHVHDLDCCGPDEAIPHLDQEVAALLLSLGNMMPEKSCDK